MRTLAFVLLAPVVLASCTARQVQRIEGGLYLTQVQRPADVADRWGEYTLVPADSGGYAYADDLLEMVVVPTRSAFVVSLRNRTEHTVRLLWDEVAYVDQRGASSGVVSGSTRILNMGQSQPPEVIPSGATARLMMIPRSHYAGTSAPLRPFFSGSITCTDPIDATFRLVVPVEVQGQTNEYTLHLAGQGQVVTVQPGTVGIPSRAVELSRVPCEEFLATPPAG